MNPARRAMLAKVHLAAKELGLDEETRRDVLERVTGHRSAGDCSDDQLDQVLGEFKRQGWKPKVIQGGGPTASRPSKGFQRAADHAVARKARAMWISLHQLGVVRDPSERSLEAFAKRQLGVERLQWADQGQGYRLIEALKAMAEKAGWSQDLAGIKPQRHVRTLKLRLVNAQLEKLGLPFLNSHGLGEAELDAMARELAIAIHEAGAP
ncbi:gp16 family protein [Phenylobacterium sp.]|uniref:gp16 family protein n=1 Tax=Phenylobacterium sp. TaxID=1871053 RepID=UPI0035B167B7